jgi:hypothetical protein
MQRAQPILAASLQLSFYTTQLCIALEDIVQRCHIRGERFLGDMGNGVMRRNEDAPGIRMQFSDDELEETGFPGAIRTRQTHALLLVELLVDMGEQQASAALQGKVG